MTVGIRVKLIVMIKIMYKVSNRSEVTNDKNLQKCQQHNSNLRGESLIDFKPITLATQAHQHLLKNIIFNF